jgi:hypothetical protein
LAYITTRMRWPGEKGINRCRLPDSFHLAPCIAFLPVHGTIRMRIAQFFCHLIRMNLISSFHHLPFNAFHFVIPDIRGGFCRFPRNLHFSGSTRDTSNRIVFKSRLVPTKRNISGGIRPIWFDHALLIGTFGYIAIFHHFPSARIYRPFLLVIPKPLIEADPRRIVNVSLGSNFSPALIGIPVEGFKTASTQIILCSVTLD